MAAAIVSEARVVGATLFRLVIFEELYRVTFDTVIVDEASMVPLPNLWFAATRASKRVVVTGDFRQLPPIATAQDKEEYPLAAKWLQTDIFEHAGVVEDRAKLDDPRLCTLRKQYRMHEAIGELANALVYARDGNPLDHKAQLKDYGHATAAYPEPEQPLVLCTTSGANPWCARLDPGDTRGGLLDLPIQPTVQPGRRAFRPEAKLDSCLPPLCRALRVPGGPKMDHPPRRQTIQVT